LKPFSKTEVEADDAIDAYEKGARRSPCCLRAQAMISIAFMSPLSAAECRKAYLQENANCWPVAERPDLGTELC
jgi:hypothetical protein